MLAVAYIIMGAAALLVRSAEIGDFQFPGRVKRQAGPPTPAQWMDVVGCCPFPMILTIESKTGCFAPPSQDNWGNHSCEVECAYRKQGFINSANGVDTSAMGVRVAEIAASTPAWASVISDALATCTKANPPALADSQCKTGAGEMSQCLSGHMISNCPAEVVDPSPKCIENLNRFRAFKSG